MNFEVAIKHYENAYRIEPEIPHYQLNLAAAHLKLQKYVQFLFLGLFTDWRFLLIIVQLEGCGECMHNRAQTTEE